MQDFPDRFLADDPRHVVRSIVIRIMNGVAQRLPDIAVTVKMYISLTSMSIFLMFNVLDILFKAHISSCTMT